MTKKGAVVEDEAGSDTASGPAKRTSLATLREDVVYLKNTIQLAVIGAGVAVMVAVTTPIWSPMVNDAFNRGSDPASARVLVLAVEQLRALSSSAPFEQQMALIRRMMAGDREVIQVLDRIEAAAPHGLPPSEQVRSEFVTVANQVFVAELFRIEPDERWINRAVVRVASAMRPHELARALELNSGGSAAALLAEAAHRLSENDLANAIRAMERLQGPYAAMAAPWLSKARARYEAIRGLEMLEALAVARLPAAYRSPASGAVPEVLNNNRHN